jgi:hypothetical protein
MRVFRRLKIIRPLDQGGDQCPKRYATVELLLTSADPEKLRAMTEAQAEYWKGKNATRTKGRKQTDVEEG